MLYNNTPVFLTEDSGYSKEQCDKINTIVRTARNRFTEAAHQKQKEKPAIEVFASKIYSRAQNFVSYKCDRNINVSFILDPSNFAKDGEYNIFEFQGNIANLNYEGSNSNTIPTVLSGLGYFRVEYNRVAPTVIFVCTTESWPVDELGNKVKYSVFMWGKTK